DLAFFAFEIDLPVFLFVTTADVARSQPAIIIATATSLLWFGQAPHRFRLRFRHFLEHWKRFETQRRRKWTKISKCHNSTKRDRSSRLPAGSRWLFSSALCGQNQHVVRAFSCRHNCRCSRPRP